MSSKKRAQIEERMNRVVDVQKWLNQMEQQNKMKAATNNNASGSKTKELNLPPNRVREMKSWLVEFEKQKKEHVNQFSTKKSAANDTLNHGAYIPVTRKQQDLRFASVDRQVEEQFGKAVNAPKPELAQFLVDFEQKNKEHFERSQRKVIEFSAHKEHPKYCTQIASKILCDERRKEFRNV